MMGLAARCVLAACIFAVVAGPGRAARAETDEIRVGLQYGLIYLPIQIAADEGFVEKRAQALGLGPLKVTVQRFSGTTAVNEALLSNSIDFGALGLPGLLIIWEKTRDKLAIKGLTGVGLTAFVLDTNKPGIKTLADFGADDRIAVPSALNSPQAILLRMAAEKLYGPGQYGKLDSMMVSLPHPDATTALIAGGSITGYFSSPPFSQRLTKDPRIHSVLTSREILGDREATGVALAGSQRFADANPKATQALYLGMEDAMRLIKTNPRSAAEIYLKSEPQKLSNEEVQAQLTDGTTIFEAAPSGVGTYAAFMLKTGMIKTKPQSWKEIFLSNAYARGGN
jgi:NitT/TauT family transport system substrate-binding protein